MKHLAAPNRSSTLEPFRQRRAVTLPSHIGRPSPFPTPRGLRTFLALSILGAPIGFGQNPILGGALLHLPTSLVSSIRMNVQVKRSSINLSCTGIEVFIGSKVQCLFCFETCTTEGRGGEKGGSANFQK